MVVGPTFGGPLPSTPKGLSLRFSRPQSVLGLCFPPPCLQLARRGTGGQTPHTITHASQSLTRSFSPPQERCSTYVKAQPPRRSATAIRLLVSLLAAAGAALGTTGVGKSQVQHQGQLSSPRSAPAPQRQPNWLASGSPRTGAHSTDSQPRASSHRAVVSVLVSWGHPRNPHPIAGASNRRRGGPPAAPLRDSLPVPLARPLPGPLLKLLLTVASGPCVLNALTSCITAPSAKARVRLLLTRYNKHEALSQVFKGAARGRMIGKTCVVRWLTILQENPNPRPRAVPACPCPARSRKRGGAQRRVQVYKPPLRLCSGAQPQRDYALLGPLV